MGAGRKISGWTKHGHQSRHLLRSRCRVKLKDSGVCLADCVGFSVGFPRHTELMLYWGGNLNCQRVDGWSMDLGTEGLGNKADKTGHSFKPSAMYHRF